MVDRPLGVLDGPAFEILDPAFESAIDPDARIERLWTGGWWVEGPAWLPNERALVWSDIPRNRMMRWSEADGSVIEFRRPSDGGNGSTVDRDGLLVTCEQYSRRITRTQADGSISVLVDNYNGKRFNAPNDVVVKSDGTIWFTDPSYGEAPEYDGELELDTCQAYRFDPATGELGQMTSDMVMPNGLAFSPDERTLYIIDTGSTHVPDGPNHIRRFDVGADGALSGGDVIAENAARMFDGLRVDTDGRLWCGAEDGVHCYAPGGKMLGKIRLPERAANLTFGGDGRDRLFITATGSLYSYATKARGAA